MRGLVYLLFFASGASGLVYQVVWVRAFGDVFGHTVQSAALVVAVFMLGLGAGSYAGGRWADHRYRTQADSLLRAYGIAELAIAALALGVSLAVPHLGRLSEWGSAYVLDRSGWWVLSTGSYLVRVAVATTLLLPITVLMGATLTLLIRYLVRERPEADAWLIAVLYATNTAGAAIGALLPDVWLVPALGFLRTQLAAVSVNALVGVIALLVSGRQTGPGAAAHVSRETDTAPRAPAEASADRMSPALVLTGLSVALSGFAAVGLEIVWLRHIGMLLGGFRAVFSLLMTVILFGIGAGSLAAAWLQHQAWWGRRPNRAGRWLMGAQGLLAAATLAGAARADVTAIDRALANADASVSAGVLAILGEIWFNAAPILAEVGVPALLMGFSFPLANAVVQHAEAVVGRTAGALYLANTLGGVAGSLAAGFLLLPGLGLQRSLTVLALAAAASAVPLFLAVRGTGHAPGGIRMRWTATPAAALGVTLAIVVPALYCWQRLPEDAIVVRAQPALGDGETRLSLTEGLTEVIAVTDVAGRGRRLLTNGHPMSATWPLSQRYMRALAHLPLLSIEQPETALVIGFGVGNTAHAVSLHPSVQRIEVVDLSRGVLEHSGYFSSANGGVLGDPRLQVFVNDGRHHLLMRPAGTFDLVTLEPPPIAYAGAGALYSQEFYALARSRLRPGGFVSQWLPVYQVPARVSLAMIRAFVDVFPDAVLVSGAGTDLLLLGTTASPFHVDPSVVERRLRARPAAQADLARVDLGTVREIVGTFVGSATTLQTATRGVDPVTDDRPLQEFAVRSLFAPDTTGLSAVANLDAIAEWCPACYRDGRPAQAAAGLDVYLALLRLAYAAPPADFARLRGLPPGVRRVAGSAYLGAVVPESAAVYNLLGVASAAAGALDQALAHFRRALAIDPGNAETRWHLGAALAASGAPEEALEHLRRAVQVDERHGPAQYDLGRLLIQTGRIEEAEPHLRAAADLLPDSADVLNDLGAVLARSGATDEAVARFQRALELRPGDPEIARNLALATRRP